MTQSLKSSKPRRILVSLTYYLPNISGVTIYADILARKLAQNYQLTILTSRFKKELAKREKKRGVSIIRLWAPFKINKALLMPFFPFTSLKGVVKTDLIICHLPQLESFWLTFWGKIFRKKVILVHHCQFTPPPGILKKPIEILVWLIHLPSYLLSDRIVAYTQDYAQSIKILNLFTKKTSFILPPVYLGPKDSRKIKQIAKRISKDEGTKIIGFVGRIAWEKGINLILKAIPKWKKEFSDFKIVFVGPYQKVVGDKTYHKLKPLLEKYRKEITLTGPISHQELVNYYYNFDCLVLPSTGRLETFGIVQPEAMLCYCPVVASNLPGVRVPVKLTGMGRIIPSNNHQDLAEAVIEVIKNKRKFKKKASLARKIFCRKEFFNRWRKLVEKSLES